MSDLPEDTLPADGEVGGAPVHGRGAEASPVLLPQDGVPELSRTTTGGRDDMPSNHLAGHGRRKKAERAAVLRSGAEEAAEASYLSGLVDRTRIDCERAEDWLRALPVTCDLIFGSPPYTNARKYKDSDGSEATLFNDPVQWASWMADIVQLALEKCRGIVAFVVAGRTAQFSYNAAPQLLVAELYLRGVTLRNPAIFHRHGIAGSGGPDYLRSDYEHIIVATNGGKLPWSRPTAMGSPCKYAPGGAMSHRLSDGSRRNEWGGTAKSGGERRPNGKRSPPRHEGDLAPVGKTPPGYIPPKIANPGNVLHVPVGGGLMGHKLAHENEAPFPERLVEWFVRSFCPPGGIVADPFMGSGTTAAVAKKFGRIGIGCDSRVNQCSIARTRLASVSWCESGGWVGL